MQNYLQSVRRKKRKGILAAVLAFAAAASMLWVSQGQNNGVAVQEDVGTGMYLYGHVSSSGAAVTRTDERNEEITVEMNNENENHAKIYTSSHVTSREDAFFDGYVSVKRSDGSVTEMELEEYVKCCVLGEMPLYFESQALMAQSIAVRSFTARRILYGTSKHRNADVCTDYRCCQSFANPVDKRLSDENAEKLEDAVNATRGIVALYEGEPIEAAYHASSGECTLNSEDVWGGKVEYLRSVKSPEGETDIYKDGYGHRVGMSQHGANLLAKQGMGYSEILSYYYKGISLGFM